MKKTVLLSALLLAGCAPQHIQESAPEDQLTTHSINNSIQNESSMNDLIADELFVQQVFGTLFPSSTLDQLEKILMEQLSTFDHRIGIIYTGEDIHGSTIDSILNKLIKENDMINGTLYTSEFSIYELEHGVLIDINSLFTTNKIEMANVINARDTLLQSLRLDGLTDREKLDRIHRAVIEGMEYAYDEDLIKNHSPSGFFLYGRGVCQAYAMAMYILLNEVGIETRFVGGELKTAIDGDTRHAWNLVKIDGVWRHVDATSNDRGNRFDNQVSTIYYLLTDEQLSSTHIWDKRYYPEAK